MKYFNIKRYKFSTILKNINLRRYKSIPVYFSALYTSILKFLSSKIYKLINIKRYLIDIKRYLIDIKRYLIDIKRYNFSRIYKSFEFQKYKNIPIYIAGFILFLIISYLCIPLFFNYNKSKIETKICQDFNISCAISGDIKYSILPTPRIILSDFIIKDAYDKKDTFGIIENIEIKLPLYNLLNKKKINFDRIILKKAKINFDLNNLKKGKNFSKIKSNSKTINFENSEIIFFDDKKSMTTIRNINFKYKSKKNIDTAILKGDFLNDDIYINFKNKKNRDNPSMFLMVKFLDTNTQVNIFDSDAKKNTVSGNISFKNDSNRLTAIFDYRDDKIFFKHANIRNIFLDGKFSGIIKLLPYFNFNLDVDLNTINFNRLYGFLIALDQENKKNLFKVSKKINGELNLSADKIFSKRTLINSMESRIKFMDGNILIEQLLLSLGKLGAADITGIINNDKKFSNLKFENNIFFDNLKRFYSKFGIFNKEKIATNLFISGNIDLINLRLRLDEISEDEKFNEEDVAYFEKKFNELLLENGYTSLFNFLNLKDFIGSVTDNTN